MGALARTGGRNSWIAWPAGLLCAAVVGGARVARAADAPRLGRVGRRHAPRGDVAARGRAGAEPVATPARSRPGDARLPGAVPRRPVGRAHLDARACCSSQDAAPPRDGGHLAHRCARAVACGSPAAGGARRADGSSSTLAAVSPATPARSPTPRCAVRASRARSDDEALRMHAHQRRRARGAHAARRAVALERGDGVASRGLRRAPRRARVGLTQTSTRSDFDGSARQLSRRCSSTIAAV